MRPGQRAQMRRYRAMDAGCVEHQSKVREQLTAMEPELTAAEQAGERPIIHFRLLEAILLEIAFGGVWPCDRVLFGPETMGPVKEDKR